MMEFVKALKSAYDASAPLKAAYPGGFWADIAPENTVFPYLTYSIPACPVVTVYGGEAAYRPTVRFAAYGTRTDCGPGNESFALVYAALVDGLEVPDKTVDFDLPSGRPIAKYLGKAALGGDVWQTSATYDYSVG